MKLEQIYCKTSTPEEKHFRYLSTTKTMLVTQVYEYFLPSTLISEGSCSFSKATTFSFIINFSEAT